MSTTKVAITIDEAILSELDRLVEKRIFPNRSKAIQEAIKDKLARMRRGRLARECAKLDRKFEQTLAEEGIDRELKTWPEY
jgi:metal-responsive CopG/Arc/MetJ family transcriptional regulator